MRGVAPGLLLACGTLSGCPLFFTQHTAPPVSPTEPVRCSESRAAPVDCGSCYHYLLAAMSAGLALGTGAVAKVGYDRTSDCQRILDRQRRCIAGERDACAALQAPTR